MIKTVIKTVVSLFLISLALLVVFNVFIKNVLTQTAVIKTVESPGGIYCAEVISVDKGALGGNTCVDVYENKGINAEIIKLLQKPQRVYCGRWGEFEDMEIYWKNDKCLVINSVEYVMK